MKYTKCEKKSNKPGDLSYYIILACVLALFILCFQPVRVFGPSMENTLSNGDFLILLRAWLVDDYEKGDIVVAAKEQFHNGENFIKRVIAIEGQVVDIDTETGTVYVDGLALNEPYISSLTTSADTDMFPLTVPENYYFLLGDNRAESVDSRFYDIGLIHKSEIKGKLLFVLFPGSN